MNALNTTSNPTETLDLWLAKATRRLAAASAAQVRAEIQQHYDAAREDALAGGATPEQAHRTALDSLGDPHGANRQYRKVLLTRSEARLLRQGNWEAQAICARPALKLALRVVPVAALGASIVAFALGKTPLAALLFFLAAAFGLALAPLFVRVDTVPRGRVVRALKLAWIAGVWWVMFQRGHLDANLSPMLVFVWIVGWMEWTRASIRRKLPVDQWPKELYL